MSNYIALNIGRNFGQASPHHGQPMAAHQWAAFQADVAAELHDMLARHGTTLLATGTATSDAGQWQGQTEDTATVWAVIENERTMPHPSVISGTAYALADEWHQDAIAVIVGGSTLVGPNAE